MNFGQAIELLKQEKRVTRRFWDSRVDGCSVFIRIFKVPGVEPCISIERAWPNPPFGSIRLGWVPSHYDIFAEDWEEVS